MRIKILLIALFLLIACPAWSATYWVDDNGTKTAKADCDGEVAISGTDACTLAAANGFLLAGDTVYLRAGTYTITGSGISPTNSGSAGNVITYSGYEDEVVTITGAADITGVSSIGIYLYGDDYIKVTKINVANVAYGLRIDNGADHNEISYGTFTFRNPWADVYLTGTAKNGTGACAAYADSATVLCDTENNLSGQGGRRIYNATDKSAKTTCGAGACHVGGATAPPTATTVNIYYDTMVGRSDSDLLWQNGDTYYITGSISYDPAAMDIGGNSTHNWIHHNVIHGYGALGPEGDNGVLFAIGPTQSGSAEENSNNTIEYNHIYHGGHHVFAVNAGFYNVVRNNYMHNEGWFDDSAANTTGNFGICSAGDNGVCGYRVIYSAGVLAYVGRTLYEGNVIGYGAQYGEPHAGSGGDGSGMTISNNNNIIRYNSSVGNVQYGFNFTNSLSSPAGDGQNNRFYNNTSFYNGFNLASWGVAGEAGGCQTTGTTQCYTPLGGGTPTVKTVDYYRVGFALDESATGNVLKNNLFHQSWAASNKNTSSVYWPSLAVGGNSTTIRSNNTASNNYLEIMANDYFSSASAFTQTTNPFTGVITLPTNSAAIIAAWSSYAVSAPNLTLSATSTAIDAGTYLTTVHADDTSSGTSLVLTDASYFQAGSAAATTPMGSSLSTVAGDYIKVGATLAAAEEVQITDINYTTNTATINPAITRADGEYVWLSRKSNGDVVLYGTTTDMGAHEYDNSGTPPSYTATVVLSGTGATMTHSGAYTVATGTTLNIGVTRNNGWNGAWSTSDGTNCDVSACSVPNEDASATCSITIGAECTVTYTATQIYRFN